MKKRLLFIPVLLCSMILASCETPSNENSETESIESTESTESIESESNSEEDLRLVAIKGEFNPFNGNYISNKSEGLGLFENATLSDGLIEMKIKNNGVKSSGIVFNSDSYANSYYYMHLSSEYGNQMTLVKVSNGVETTLKSCYVTAGYNKNALVKLRVEFSNGDIKCFYDDKMLVCYVDEDPLTGSYFGLKTYNSSTTFGEIRYSETREFKQVETLIIGHSYMELWGNYKNDLSRYEDIFNIGIGGTASSDWVDHYDEVIAYNPSRIIYMIGINDVPRNMSATDISNNIKNLCNSLLETLETTEICLVSINQCPTHVDFKNKIVEANSLIKNYTATSNRLYYADLDNAFLLEDGTPDGSCFVDGLHPNAEAYLVIAQAIYDAFDNKEEVDPLDARTTLIIGHSYMDLWKDNCVSDLSHYKNVINIGVGGTNSLYWANRINEIVSYNPIKIIYMTGINDIPHGVENRTLYTHLNKVLVDVQAEIEDAEICLLSIPQVPIFFEQYEEKIDEANNYYKKLALDLDHVYYGDVDDAYLNSDGTPNEDCFSDGLHPLSTQYGVIVDAIDDAFNNVNQPTADDIYVEVDNVEYQEDSAETFVTDLSTNNETLNWEYNEASLKTTSTGLALSSETYNNFDLVYSADILTLDNPYFSNDCKKGIVFGAEYTNTSFKGYFLSLGHEWIELCYSDGTQTYKCSFIDGYNFCSSYANIKISVNKNMCTITYGDGANIGNSFSGSTTFALPNYEGGKIGVLNNENSVTTFNFKEVVAKAEINDVDVLLEDLSTSTNKNDGNDFVIDKENKTITTSSNNGYLISNESYTNFSIGLKVNQTNALNPFFEHIAQEAILIGGSYTDGKYSGYAINFDNTSWIEVVYIDGTNNNSCTFIDGWCLSYLNKNLVITVSGANVYLNSVEGETVPSTFNNNSCINIPNYNGGKLGLLSYDGAATTYTFNSLNII